MTYPTPADLAGQIADTGLHLNVAVADLRSASEAHVVVSQLARMAHELPNLFHGVQTFLVDQVTAGNISRGHQSDEAIQALRKVHGTALKLYGELSDASSALENL